MAFRLHCDRCLRLVDVIDAKKVKEIAIAGRETVCPKCQESERQMTAIIENLKREVNKKLNALDAEMKGQLVEELKKVVQKNAENG